MSLELIGGAQAAKSTAMPMPNPGTTEEFENFIYILSHDVRNSVRALIEIPWWIKEDLVANGHQIDENLAENLALLDRYSQRLDRMLSDLLAYSRVGRIQSIETISLADALDDVKDQLRVPSGFTIQDRLACHMIQMGERDARLLLHVLLENAIKHHDASSGSVTITSRQVGQKCLIEVEDDGPGIAEKHRDKIFETMTTLQPRDVVEGSGMGLAIARKIARFYGGELKLMPSLNDRGTVMQFSINPVDQ